MCHSHPLVSLMKTVLKFPVDNPLPERMHQYYDGGVSILQHRAIDLLKETLDVCSIFLKWIESAPLASLLGGARMLDRP